MALTPEQVENWRNTLSMTLGPYAGIMPVEQIEAYVNMMQAKIDSTDWSQYEDVKRHNPCELEQVRVDAQTG